MTIHTPIESPGRVDKNYAVFKIIYGVIRPKKYSSKVPLRSFLVPWSDVSIVLGQSQEPKKNWLMEKFYYFTLLKFYYSKVKYL